MARAAWMDSAIRSSSLKVQVSRSEFAAPGRVGARARNGDSGCLGGEGERVTDKVGVWRGEALLVERAALVQGRQYAGVECVACTDRIDNLNGEGRDFNLAAIPVGDGSPFAGSQHGQLAACCQDSCDRMLGRVRADPGEIVLGNLDDVSQREHALQASAMCIGVLDEAWANVWVEHDDASFS